MVTLRRTTFLGCAAIMTLVVSPAPLRVDAAAAPAATVCTSEQYQWFGEAPVAPGATVGTGVSVDAIPGTQLQVVVVDYSTSPVVSHDLSISIGSAQAVAGNFVDGGEITATNIGVDQIDVTSIALSVDRCHQVESAVPDPAVRVAAPAPPTEPSVTAATDPSVESAGGPALPHTGNTSGGLIVVASGLLGGGLLLRRISRRRAAA